VLPWSALMRGNREFHIVLADTSVGGVQNMMRSRLSLSDYLDRKYIPNEDKLPAEDLHFYRYMMSNQFTSASYAITAARIAQFAQSYGASATVSYARDLSLRTFQGGGNFVVIGTSRANPWAQLFEGQLNFVLQFEDASREPWFVNRAPKAGEPAVYTPPGGSPGGMSESYGHVAFIPALYRGGDILFVTGTNSQATEAAGEFVTNVDDLNAAFAKAGVKAGSGERPFELLLRVRHTGGAPVRAELIAQR
jgi:hypothetical protein